MPNHCDNYLSACGGTQKTLNAFHKFVGNEIDFNKILPRPQALQDQAEKGPLPLEDRDGPNWYDWSVKNWGTKWNAYEHSTTERDYDRGEINYNFLTAWGPPTPIVHELQRRFPTLCITMYFSIDCAGDGWVDDYGKEVYAEPKQENGRLISG